MKKIILQSIPMLIIFVLFDFFLGGIAITALEIALTCENNIGGYYALFGVFATLDIVVLIGLICYSINIGEDIDFYNKEIKDNK